MHLSLSPSVAAVPEGVVGGEAEVGERSSECGRLAQRPATLAIKLYVISMSLVDN